MKRYVYGKKTWHIMCPVCKGWEATDTCSMVYDRETIALHCEKCPDIVLVPKKHAKYKMLPRKVMTKEYYEYLIKR